MGTLFSVLTCKWKPRLDIIHGLSAGIKYTVEHWTIATELPSQRIAVHLKSTQGMDSQKSLAEVQWEPQNLVNY